MFKITSKINNKWIDNMFAEDNLDRDSNKVIFLIREGKLDEAEAQAKQLLIDYPEVHDGYDRLAMVYEKRGDRVKAVEMYKKALDFILNDDGHEEEARDYYREKIIKLS
jgi:tetratricopeptide (TPR) repeat protein